MRYAILRSARTSAVVAALAVVALPAEAARMEERRKIETMVRRPLNLNEAP
jgi:hypothetical protein